MLAGMVWYRLSAEGDPNGVSCGKDGVFVGPVPLLTRVRDRNGREKWEARSAADLNADLGARYGFPVDMAAKRSGLNAIANALNAGQVSVAKIATLHLQLPDLPALTKGMRPRVDDVALVALLHRSGMLKTEGFDPSKHPRWEAGAPDSRGGQFRPADQPGDGGTPTPDEAPPLVPAQEIIIRPAPFPWDIPFRIPAPPTEVAPYLDLPGQQRDSIPQNPYPDRPECAEEWDHATRACKELDKRGLLGKGDYRNFGKNLWQCLAGVVSEDCGGRSTRA